MTTFLVSVYVRHGDGREHRATALVDRSDLSSVFDDEDDDEPQILADMPDWGPDEVEHMRIEAIKQRRTR